MTLVSYVNQIMNGSNPGKNIKPDEAEAMDEKLTYIVSFCIDNDIHISRDILEGIFISVCADYCDDYEVDRQQMDAAFEEIIKRFFE